MSQCQGNFEPVTINHGRRGNRRSADTEMVGKGTSGTKTTYPFQDLKTISSLSVVQPFPCRFLVGCDGAKRSS